MAIKFNYNQTINQAKQLEELASDMEMKCCKKVDEAIRNVEASWSGEASKAYCKLVQGIHDDLLGKAGYMRNLADFLRTAAKKIKAAEESAAAAAKSI